MPRLDRRQFLKRTTLGTAAALAAGPLRSPAHPSENHETEEPLPLRRTLGRTGIKLPVVSMGVMRADNPGLVRAAMKRGIVHFDTAHGYQRGTNEEMLGKVLSEYPRQSFVLGTKVPWRGREDFLSKFEISLGRLKMTHVDILYAHSVSSRGDVLDDELLGTLKELKQSGKVRHAGVSTHKNEPEVIRAAAESNVIDVVLTSVNFRQEHYPEVKSAIAEATRQGVGIVAMKTMAGGYFDKDRSDPINCRAALKWALQDENVATSIPGITSYDELEADFSVASDLTLTDAERAELRLGDLRGGLYCNGCDTCTGSCSRALPIPDLMRGYMYTYGYARAVMGREVVLQAGTGVSPCEGCAECTARCVKGFDLKARLADVSRLAAIPEELLSGVHCA
jgi:predicted aldo/keto reductase-like oxidoreductase